MKKFNRILIVRTDRIGDVILTTPVIKAIRQNNPDAFIVMLVSATTKDLVVGNPFLNEVIIDDKEGAARGFFGFLKLVQTLKKFQFDTAFVFHTKKRTNLLCFLAGISNRIGYRNDKFGFLLTHPLTDERHLGKKHETQYCLDVLKALNIQSTENALSVSINERAEQWAEEKLKTFVKNENPLIGVHPGASDPSKCWPPHYFAQVMNMLKSRYNASFVIIGGVDIYPLAEAIKKDLQAPVLDLTGQTTVSQMVSVLKRCKILLSNDSGPVHVASALGIGVVSIFTRNQPGINPERWQPLGKKAKTVAIAPNFDLSFEKSGSATSKYLELIKPQEVFEAVDALIKLC